VIDRRAGPAKLALAGLAYLAGQHDVAERLHEDKGDENEPSVWVEYMYPGADDWNSRLEALRKEARSGQ
jgi:hypothetical protein